MSLEAVITLVRIEIRGIKDEIQKHEKQSKVGQESPSYDIGDRANSIDGRAAKDERKLSGIQGTGSGEEETCLAIRDS
jgi:hypothetical protein